MISYIFLLFALIVIAVIAFFVFKKDFMAPSFITAVVYAISVSAAIVGFLSWNSHGELSLMTIAIVILGVVGVFFGELFQRKISTKVFGKKKKDNIESVGKIANSKEIGNRIPIWVLAVTSVFVLATIVLTYFEIRRVCLHYSHNPTGLTDMLSFYRTKTLLFGTEAVSSGVTINFFVQQMQKICYFVAVFYMYFFIDFLQEKKKKSWLRIFMYLSTILMVFALTLLTSSRSLMMHLCIAFAVLYIMIRRRAKGRDNNMEKKRVVRKVAIVGIPAIIVFYLLTPIMGRADNMNFVDYMTFYIGTPVPSLDYALENKTLEDGKGFGANTFYGVYYSLAKMGISESYPEPNREGVVYGKYGGSNVYTSFSSYYLDFGLLGVVILSFLFGWLTSTIYELVKRKNYNVFGLVLFAYYFYVLIDQVRGDLFYSLISVSTISYIVIAFLLYKAYGFLAKEEKCVEQK